VEQSAVNRSVVGSSPTQGASLMKTPFTQVNGVLPCQDTKVLYEFYFNEISNYKKSDILCKRYRHF
ncbi:MAG: hypothetical protein H6Q69_2595, partial [Firmicutes bacterium]|nr:hypothetical protein [Bacillota bacterium]